MVTRRAVLLAVTAAAIVIAVAFALGQQAEAPTSPVASPPAPSPTASAEPAVTNVAIDCAVRAAAAGPSPSPAIETCTGSVRMLGPGAVRSLDVWVDSIDASGRPLFSCRSRVGDDVGPGLVLPWRTICEAQSGTAQHRVRFTDRAGVPLRTAAPGQ